MMALTLTENCQTAQAVLSELEGRREIGSRFVFSPQNWRLHLLTWSLMAVFIHFNTWSYIYLCNRLTFSRNSLTMWTFVVWSADAAKILIHSFNWNLYYSGMFLVKDIKEKGLKWIYWKYKDSRKERGDERNEAKNTKWLKKEATLVLQMGPAREKVSCLLSTSMINWGKEWPG